jgi:hypothetical protein
VGASFTAGNADCATPYTTSVPVTIATKPLVSIEGVSEAQQVCSNETSVAVSFTVSSGAAGTPLTVTPQAKSGATVLDTVDCRLPAGQGDHLDFSS